MTDDADPRRLRSAYLDKQFAVHTGRHHRFQIVADLVEAYVEWPAHVVERLSDDFTLTLSGPDTPRQRLTKADAIAVGGDADGDGHGDMMRFEFRWRERSSVVLLEAESNGQRVALWRGHVAGDLTVDVDWDRRLDPLLSPPAEVEIVCPCSGATQVPADLRGHELSALLAELFS